MASRTLPRGLVAFLLTDVEDSTPQWERHHDAMVRAMALHDELAHGIVNAHHGHLPLAQGEGDSFLAAFADPLDAVQSAIDLQHALAIAPFPDGIRIAVRMSLHVGQAEVRAGNYYGVALARCARVRNLAWGEQVLVTGALAEILRTRLPEHVALRSLGTHPLKGLSAPERVFQLVHPSIRDGFGPLRGRSARRDNLPADLSTLIGHDAALAECSEVASRSRLVVVTGPGGVGKTRMAIAVGRGLRTDQPGGVWLVDLLTLNDPRMIAEAIAEVVAPAPSQTSPIERICDEIADDATTLLLDTAERLLDEILLVAIDLLNRCPQLRIVIGSRRSTALTVGETFTVSPLPLPHAVALFVERARAHGGLGLDQLDAIERICEELDGLPLAIELAAARTRLIDAATLADRIADRFKVLGATTRGDAPQTLRTVLSWSIEALTVEARQLLLELSVFASGLDLVDVESFSTLDDPLEALTTLYEHSLLVSDPEDRARFRLLRSARAYAAELADDDGSTAALKERHTSWVETLVDAAAPHIARGDAQREWLDRLDLARTELDTALDHLIACENAVRAAPILLRLREFWEVRGHARSALRCLEGLLSLTPPATLRVELLRAQAGCLIVLGEMTRAEAVYEQALAATPPDDQAQRSMLLGDLGVARHRLGNLDGAAEALGAAESLATDDIERRRLANNRAIVALDRGYLDEARTVLVEILPSFRRAKDRRGEAAVRNNLGLVAQRADDHVAAADHYRDAIAIRRGLGDRGGLAESLGNLSDAMLRQGDLDQAASLAADTLALTREIGDRHSEADALLLAAEIDLARGAPDDAARSLEGARALAIDLDDEALMEQVSALSNTG